MQLKQKETKMYVITAENSYHQLYAFWPYVLD